MQTTLQVASASLAVFFGGFEQASHSSVSERCLASDECRFFRSISLVYYSSSTSDQFVLIADTFGGTSEWKTWNYG